ncbi:MAG TPA: N-acetylmuramoyl-L-alanine amidase [Gemmatimonadaceae bacterium]
MIAGLLLASLQVAGQVAAVTVHDGDRSVSVPVVFTRSGPLLRATEILPPLGGRLTRVPPDRVIVEVEGIRFEFTLGLPFARVGETAAPLAIGPLIRDGDVFLPFATVSELLPRFVKGFSWDSARSAVVRVGARVVSAGTVATPRTGAPTSRTAAEPGRPRAGRTLVVVDAGHGGPDRGMSGPTGARSRIYEADITLAIAKRLRAALVARGIDVHMTRMTDTLIALRDRGRIANEKEAVLFLSIHVNAANPRWRNPRSARGFETYFLSDAKTEDERRVAEMENEADRFLDVDAQPGDPLLFLLSDMKQNEYLRESSELASAVQAGLKTVHPSGVDRGVKQAGFAVLLAAHMPAALVEVGFGTNASDAAWLKSATGQQQLADAIAKSTQRYLDDYARRGGANLGGR